MRLHICMHVVGPARTDERVKREAIALHEAGCNVTIVDVEADATRPSHEDVGGVHLRHVIMPRLRVAVRFKPFFLIKLARIMASASFEMARLRADVYHAHDDNALLATYMAAVLHRKPLIFDAHELPLSEPSVTRRRILHSVAVRVLQRLMRRCVGVITVSAPIARDIQVRYGGPPPVLVRNMPVYHEPPADSNEIQAYFGLSPRQRVALYQGVLQKNRALDILVHAAKHLDPENVVVIIGTGPARAELDARVAREGVGESVRIIAPPVPYDQLLRWTASADLGLILYRADHSLNVRYCLPNKLFEYLMAGVPVLVSKLDAVADVVNSFDVGRVVESLDPPDVAAAINQLLSDRAGLDTMRANCLAASRMCFRWDVEQQRLLDLYQDVLGTQLTYPPASGHVHEQTPAL
jgi:glycosyltransferase involved in cell wall biosynthesis